MNACLKEKVRLKCIIILSKHSSIFYQNELIHTDKDYKSLNASDLISWANIPVADRKKCKFHVDPLVPNDFKVYHKDYLSSGYDRGHMIPAGDFMSTQGTVLYCVLHCIQIIEYY